MSAAVEAAARSLNPLAWQEYDRMTDMAGEPSPQLVIYHSEVQAKAALGAALPHLTEGLGEVLSGAERQWRMSLITTSLSVHLATVIAEELRRRIEP